MTWRPASKEIDPLQEAVLNAARATILPTAAVNSPAPASDGVRALTLEDGRQVRIALTAREMSKETRNGRAQVTYAFSGNAVADRAGYRVTGEAVIDLTTRAFLNVSCRLEPVGSITP